MVNALRDILDGKDTVMPKTPSAPVLYQTWQTSGVAAVLEQWKSMQSGAVYDTRESELGRLAGTIAGKKKIADALVLAKAAEAQAPKSVGVAMLLGRVEAAAGHKV